MTLNYIQLGLLLGKPQQALEFVVLSAHLLIPLHGRRQRLRLLAQSVCPRGCAKRDGRIDGNLLRLVRFQPNVTQKSAMSCETSPKCKRRPEQTRPVRQREGSASDPRRKSVSSPQHKFCLSEGQVLIINVIFRIIDTKAPFLFLFLFFTAPGSSLGPARPRQAH